MRDIFVTVVVFLALPMIFKRPYWGAVMWIWISVMNPHAQGWGFARTFPFAALIAIVTVASLVMYRGDKRLTMTPVITTFFVFGAFMSLTCLTAIHPNQMYDQWIKVIKIMGMTVVVFMVLKERKHVEAAIWSVVVSIGYYGVKGGVFTIRSGGSERVWGPAGTFIDGNNEVALAFVMVIPLMYYLMRINKNKWVRRALMVSMGLCALSSLGSYSRGAFLALAAMGAFLWIKSKEKVVFGLVLMLLVPVMLLAMPAKWFERMDTVKTYQEDASAMGRVNAWQMAFNLAKDRPLGGGFQIYDREVFAMYAPVANDVHAAHSIYFQVLGEHGFLGLAIYLLLGVLTWRTGSWIVKHTRHQPDLIWAADLSMMIQVSLLGFAVGGAFLSLAYFDVPYYLMAAIVAARLIVERELRAKAALAKAAKLAKPAFAPAKAPPLADLLSLDPSPAPVDRVP